MLFLLLFSDLQPRSGLSSGGLTPDLRSMSPDTELDPMKDLLSALHDISGSEAPVQEQATKVSRNVTNWNGNEITFVSQFQASGSSGEVQSAPVVEIKEEQFEEQAPRERSNTMPSAEPTPIEEEAVPGGVVLRVPTGPKQSPEKRKSGEIHNENIRPKSLSLLICVYLYM